jgi:hypothetical protein
MMTRKNAEMLCICFHEMLENISRKKEECKRHSSADNQLEKCGVRSLSKAGPAVISAQCVQIRQKCVYGQSEPQECKTKINTN